MSRQQRLARTLDALAVIGYAIIGAAGLWAALTFAAIFD